MKGSELHLQHMAIICGVACSSIWPVAADMYTTLRRYENKITKKVAFGQLVGLKGKYMNSDRDIVNAWKRMVKDQH